MISLVIICVVSAILVTIANAFCVVIILLCKELHKPSHMAVFSLLLTHVIEGVFVLPSYAVERSGKFQNEAACDIFRFSYLLGNYISCFSVLVISIDRFIGVQFPFRYNMYVTKQRIKGIIIFIWVYVTIICLIPFIPSNRKDNCLYNPQKEWVITMLFLHTLLPFLIIVACNIVIFKKTAGLFKRKRDQSIERRRSRLFVKKESLLSEEEPDLPKLRRHGKNTKVSFLIIISFIVFSGPSLFYYLLLTLCPEKCFPNGFFDRELDIYDHSMKKEIIGFVVKFLPLMEGVISPLIYCWYNAGFINQRKMLSEQMHVWFSSSRSIVKRGNCIFKQHEGRKDSEQVADIEV